MWPLNRGDYLIEVTAWAGLTVFLNLLGVFSKVPELCFLIQLMNVFEFLNHVDHFHTKVNFQMN